jgi:hypothetical protein
MKTKLILLSVLLSAGIKSNAQVLLNEVYTDPGGNKHEFFELYNTNTSSLPESMDNYTLVTFFEYPGGNGELGFYVMDFPNLSLAPKGYFVGSAALPFSCQGLTNSTASDFDWNSPAFRSGSTGGYLKKWVYKQDNLTDGNPDYDEASLPADFNDFFFRRVGIGASYTIFLYKNGVFVNGVIFGTGGYTEVIPIIINMPNLKIDMSGSATDFELDFSTYGSLPIEDVIQDAGSDNGYMREADGKCGGWLKSDAQAQHTPQQTNGAVDGDDGVISVSTSIIRGNSTIGSRINYDVVSAPVTSFPINLEVYNDKGPTTQLLDGLDSFIAENTETIVTDGPFTTQLPFNINVLLVVKSNVGCIDKILFVPNVSILPVKLIAFNGNTNNGTTRLEWSVTSNEQAYKFEIEKSFDGKEFKTAQLISATGKTGNENYTYQEESAFDKIYYRLKITDKSGVVSYSKIVSFRKETETRETLNIIGNTVTDKLTLSFQAQTNQLADINIMDMGGRLVIKQRIQVQKGNNVSSFSLPSTMNGGMYVAAMSIDNTISTAKFIKQ